MSAIDRLLTIMARLRDPQRGCPWDQEQTFATIGPYTLEEAYEVVDAIERGDMDDLRDELGDLLFQVVFYARMAEEAGLYAFDDIVESICDKMIRRHPHVFGDVEVGTATEQTAHWERHKERERHARASEASVPPSALDGVSAALPATTRAHKLQRRAARVGFDWSDVRAVTRKLDEEIAEFHREMDTDAPAVRLHDEIGDILFTCVNLARHVGIDPETALRHANAKFERRFRTMEAMCDDRGLRPQHLSLAELDALWEKAKANCD